MWWLFLLGCGGGDAEGPAEAAPAAVTAVDSPFCASFEACLEGLPGWAPDCDRWWAGDPDCSSLDFSQGPADWYDETSRGIAALRQPGLTPEELVVDEKGDFAPAQESAEKEPAKTALETKGERK